ncbi:MAG: bifunctional oligoribonuclease/PAP phosphatase NrnA [Clostridia bacterium]
MINQVLDLLNHDNFLILTHKKPDGDTTGSASALCQILRAKGKTAYIAKNEDITPRYAVLVNPYLVPDDFSHDFIISTDVASTELLCDSTKKYENDIDMCIDHHFLSNNGFAKQNVIIDTAACGEIIYDIAVKFGVELNEDIARSIYISISTDTGCFKYSNTTVNTHLVAAECLKHITNAGEINRELFDMKTRQRVAIERKILQEMEILFDGKVAIVGISKQDKIETGATPDDLDSIAALPRSIEGVLVAITLNEQDNGDIKVSARSSGDASASEICSIYGGGGHLRAAGVTFADATMEQAKEKMIEAIKKVCKYV